jgi:hypothetical protein
MIFLVFSDMTCKRIEFRSAIKSYLQKYLVLKDGIFKLFT